MNITSSIVNNYILESPITIESRLKAIEPFSIQEQIRLIPPLHFNGVKVFILDESSGMHTGSFKALDASVCIGDCIRKGINEICFTSGANTGMALTAYGNQVGIKTHFFIPASNGWKLDSRYVKSPLSYIYAVEDSDLVKELCKGFSNATNIPLMPLREHRHQGSRRRGAYIATLIEEGFHTDWFVQTVCAGFGPIGIYDYLYELQLLNKLKTLPKFLAVQQSGNNAMTKWLSPRLGESRILNTRGNGALIEATMYDKHPETYETFDEMEKVFQLSAGAIIKYYKGTVRRYIYL